MATSRRPQERFVLGNYKDDLTQFLLESGNNLKQASSRANQLILGSGIKAKVPFIPFRMYGFYYEAKTVNEWDMYPIAISLGLTNDLKNQLCINLHFIPISIRLKFLEYLVKHYDSFLSYSAVYAGQPKNQSAALAFNYDSIIRFLKHWGVDKAIRQYRTAYIIDPRHYSFEEWYLGAIHDEHTFFGLNKTKIHEMYFKSK